MYRPASSYRLDLDGVVGGDSMMPVEPDPPAVRHAIRLDDINDACSLPVPAPPVRRVEGPQILRPPGSQMFGDRAVNFANDACPGDSNRAARLDELGEVIEIGLSVPK